jgi:hypothetical protein
VNNHISSPSTEDEKDHDIVVVEKQVSAEDRNTNFAGLKRLLGSQLSQWINITF